MSVKTRWTNEEELNLVKDISTGSTLDAIAQKHGRSVTAVELRLKKIIYVNACSGKSIETISKLLKIPEDRVRQHFYAYKDFKEKNTKVVDKVINEQIGGDIKIDGQNQLNQSNNNSSNNNISNTNGYNNSIVTNNMNGGNINKNSKVESKLKKLEMENKILKLIVENKDLTHKLNKLIKEGKIDKSVKDFIKTVRKMK